MDQTHQPKNDIVDKKLLIRKNVINKFHKIYSLCMLRVFDRCRFSQMVNRSCNENQFTKNARIIRGKPDNYTIPNYNLPSSLCSPSLCSRNQVRMNFSIRAQTTPIPHFRLN